MRILGLLKADKHSEAGAPPTKELLERMGRFIEEITNAGVLRPTDSNRVRRARASSCPKAKSPLPTGRLLRRRSWSPPMRCSR